MGSKVAKVTARLRNRDLLAPRQTAKEPRNIFTVGPRVAELRDADSSRLRKSFPAAADISPSLRSFNVGASLDIDDRAAFRARLTRMAKELSSRQSKTIVIDF